MALTFKFEPEQLERLITSIDNLSDNLAKWQGQQTLAIEQGFASLVSTLGGDVSEEVQQRIDEIANTVRTVKEKLQTSVDNQTKGD